MKKIILALTVINMVTLSAFSEMTTAELRSAENLKNEGYSTAVIETVQKQSGEFSVAPTNIFQKVGFKIWNYIDPSSPQARDAETHDIKTYSHYSDL